MPRYIAGFEQVIIHQHEIAHAAHRQAQSHKAAAGTEANDADFLFSQSTQSFRCRRGAQHGSIRLLILSLYFLHYQLPLQGSLDRLETGIC